MNLWSIKHHCDLIKSSWRTNKGTWEGTAVVLELFCGWFLWIITQQKMCTCNFRSYNFTYLSVRPWNLQPVINATVSPNVLLRQPLLGYDKGQHRICFKAAWAGEMQLDRQKEASRRKRLNASRYVKWERERRETEGGWGGERNAETQGVMTE